MPGEYDKPSVNAEIQASSGSTVAERDRFLERCRPTPDGFAAISDVMPWRLGAVLLGRRSDDIAVVRKAADAGGAYEFAGRLALPGGMVRTAGLADLASRRVVFDALERSLRERAAREAGIVVRGQLRPLDLGPIATSYSAKGRRSFTLVLAYAGSAEAPGELKSGDSSIDAAFWMSRPIDWASFAPANCMLLGHVLWPLLDVPEREAARPPIRAAHSLCSGWSSELLLPPLPQPWATTDDLEVWRASWSDIA